jgi:hypothetical protein
MGKVILEKPGIFTLNMKSPNSADDAAKFEVIRLWKRKEAIGLVHKMAIMIILGGEPIHE